MTTTENTLVEVPALFTLDGRLASTHYLYGPLGDHGHRGPYWRLTDVETARYGARHVYPSVATKAETRARYLRGKGFTAGTVRVPAIFEAEEGAARIATVAG